MSRKRIDYFRVLLDEVIILVQTLSYSCGLKFKRSNKFNMFKSVNLAVKYTLLSISCTFFFHTHKLWSLNLSVSFRLLSYELSNDISTNAERKYYPIERL